MGQKWLQTLHLVKAKSPEGAEKKPKQRKGKKWKFWKSSVHASDGKQELAAPKKPDNYGTKEWAAVVIQTAFRVFLARRALRAIRGLVRLQALVRGRKVRKQATITLRCMQTLVKVQAGVRARQAKMLNDISVAHLNPDQQAAAVKNVDVKASEKVWSDSVWTKEELINRIQEKQKAAVKRERALAYAFSHQWRAHTKPPPNTDEVEWGWLERWMASRPWENRAVEEALKHGMLQHAAIQETCNSTPKETSHKDEPAQQEMPTKKENNVETARNTSHNKDQPVQQQTPTKKESNVEAARKISSKDEPVQQQTTPTKKDSPETSSKTSTPAKKDGASPIKLLLKKDTSLDSPSKLATPKKVNASRSGDSVDSPKSIQSTSNNNAKFHSPGSVKSSPATPTKAVVNGVFKPVVKSRYMEPKKVVRADSAPKMLTKEEIEQQKRRLSLPSPRAREMLKPKSPIKV